MAGRGEGGPPIAVERSTRTTEALSAGSRTPTCRQVGPKQRRQAPPDNERDLKPAVGHNRRQTRRSMSLWQSGHRPEREKLTQPESAGDPERDCGKSGVALHERSRPRACYSQRRLIADNPTLSLAPHFMVVLPFRASARLSIGFPGPRHFFAKTRLPLRKLTGPRRWRSRCSRRPWREIRRTEVPLGLRPRRIRRSAAVGERSRRSGFRCSGEER